MTGSVAVDKSIYGKNKLAQWGVADDQMSNGQKWLCFWVLFAFGACCVYQWMMVAPALGQIAAVFNIGMESIGLLMSVYTIAGLILAYPCTWIMRTYGIKFSLLVTGALSILGNIICLVTVDATVFLVGRTIQGCGFGLIAVLGPNIMPRLFPLEKQGLVMGIWSQWVTPGIALGSLTTPMMFATFGWQSIYYLSTILTIITTVLVFFFVKMPLVPENKLREDELNEENVSQSKKKTYVKSAFIIGFSFIAWATMYGCFNSYFPMFCQEVAGLDMQTASLTTLTAALCTIPTGILVGWLADKICHRRILLITGYVITGIVFMFFEWNSGDSQAMIWVVAVLLGLVCAAMVPTMTRALIPVLAQKPKETDWALTGMAFVTQAGGLLATLFPTLVAATSWNTAALIFGGVITVVALVLIIPTKDDHSIDLSA